MPRVHFTADHDYRHPKFPQTVAYKAGHKGLVTVQCAEEAVRLGRAELIGAYRRAAEPGSEAETQPEEQSDDGAGGGG